jgi:heme exporter protein CcmD
VSHAGYVFAGYAVVFAVLVTFAIWVLAKGRALAKRVPPEEMPWT